MNKSIRFNYSKLPLHVALRFMNSKVHDPLPDIYGHYSSTRILSSIPVSFILGLVPHGRTGSPCRRQCSSFRFFAPFKFEQKTVMGSEAFTFWTICPFSLFALGLCDGILQPAVIEEVAATIEGLDNCSGRAKTRDVAPTTKLEGSMSICTQQSVDGEVVVVRGQSIHERMESNAKGQIAKGNEMVSFKIGDQVLYSQSHKSNRKDSKQYGPSVISQICGGNMYLLAGLKRKYHSNQLKKVNMITSQVN